MNTKPSIQILSFGYHGWGNHTPELVKAVDAVEASRGFNPPLFVDIRISRSVRAAGFTGPAFERLLSQGRYLWMKSLGNEFIKTRTGPSIQIADPKAAGDLLDIAIESARQQQRVLFFCNCERPRCDGKIACHRTTVTGLVIKTAMKRGITAAVIEWPGGEPRRLDLDVSPDVFAAVRKGRKSVPLTKQIGLAEAAGLPWCSIATLRSGGETLRRIVGPAIAQNEGWAFRVLCPHLDPAATIGEYQMEAEKLRKASGWNQAIVEAEPVDRNERTRSPQVKTSHLSLACSTYTSESVYTILHSSDLAEIFRSGRSGTFVEGKKWVSAERVLRAARSAGQVFPVIFAPGENIRELTHFAELDDVTITQDKDGKWTSKVSVTNLTKIRPPRPMKTELKVCSTGKKLPMDHIRPYVLVHTPNFLPKVVPKT